MSRIQSVKGVSATYDRLVKLEQNPLTPYESKSPEFRSVVKDKETLMKLYESILLDGPNSSVYTSLLADIGGTPSTRTHITRKFQEEIRADIDKITRNSHMIRTNECPRDKIYYNGKTVTEMMKKMNEFMSKPEFYDKLSKENKKMLQNFLQVDMPKIDLADPNYQEKMDKEIREQCEKLIKSDLIPFIEKVTTDENYEPFMKLASRLANGQVNAKNLPTKMEELNIEVSESNIENLYKVVGFMTGFSVEGQFEPEEIKKELCKQDSKMVDAADKSTELTTEDIKMIFANADKFNKKDMVLTPLKIEDQIFAQPSDPKLRDGSNMSYEQAINAIKSGLDDVLAGAKYDTLDPNIARYVRFLVNNCPDAQFLPNINLADAHDCRLAKGNEASKTYEPTGYVEKYMVVGPRFTSTNVEELVNQIIKDEETKSLFMDENGITKVRIDTLARVMNKEIDKAFLSPEEIKCLDLLESHYKGLKPEEQSKYITGKDEYKAGKNTLLTVNDMKILFECFAANADKDPRFRMFRFSEKDFEENKNGKPGKMLQRFGCSYEEFFQELHAKYLEAYEQKAIFASGDDKYTTFLRFIMGYCKDITYAPAVGMTNESNTEEPVYENVEAEAPMIPLFQSNQYSKAVLSLPSARNLPRLDLSAILRVPDKKIQEKMNKIVEQKRQMQDKKRNIEARIKEVKSAAKGRKLNDDESKIVSFLKEKISVLDKQIQIITEKLDIVDDKLVQDMEAQQAQSGSQKTPGDKMVDVMRVMQMSNGGKPVSTEQLNKMMMNPNMMNMMRDSSPQVSSTNVTKLMEKYSDNKEEVHAMLDSLIIQNDLVLSGKSVMNVKEEHDENKTEEEKREEIEERIEEENNESKAEKAEKSVKAGAKKQKSDVSEAIKDQVDGLTDDQKDIIADDDADLAITAEYMYDDDLESEIQLYLEKSKQEKAKTSQESVIEEVEEDVQEEQVELEEIMEEADIELEEIVDSDEELEEIADNDAEAVKKAKEKAVKKVQEEELEEGLAFTYKPGTNN